MSPELTALLVGAGCIAAAVVFVLLLGVLVFLVELWRGYQLADRILGPPSSVSDDLKRGLLVVMDDDPTPHGRRHG